MIMYIEFNDNDRALLGLKLIAKKLNLAIDFVSITHINELFRQTVGVDFGNCPPKVLDKFKRNCFDYLSNLNLEPRFRESL